MSWHRDVAETSTDELVNNNSHYFAVSQWRKACRDYLELIDRQNAEMRELIDHLNEAQHIGRAVLAYAQQGRKVLRIDELVSGDPS